jgi:hypothetical protein
VLPIGIVELVCLALYLVPQTSVLGALMLTGYLGGAIATHVRAASPLFSHTLFPLYVALLLWGALYLREPRLAELLPYRRFTIRRFVGVRPLNRAGTLRCRSS